jgi:intron-binding protein aquarius
MGLQLRPSMAPALDSSTSNMNDTPASGSASAGEGWEQVAQELWLGKSTTPSPRPDLVKSRIWDPLEAEAFSWRSLSLLESLQILERYGHDHSYASTGRYADDG